MFGGHKAAIFTQVGQFYFGRWVSFSSAVTLGGAIRSSTAGIAHEIAGEDAKTSIDAAKAAAENALSQAGTKKTLNNYNGGNH